MSFLFGGQISTDKLILQLVYVFIVLYVYISLFISILQTLLITGTATFCMSALLAGVLKCYKRITTVKLC